MATNSELERLVRDSDTEAMVDNLMYTVNCVLDMLERQERHNAKLRDRIEALEESHKDDKAIGSWIAKTMNDWHDAHNALCDALWTFVIITQSEGFVSRTVMKEAVDKARIPTGEVVVASASGGALSVEEADKEAQDEQVGQGVNEDSEASVDGICDGVGSGSGALDDVSFLMSFVDYLSVEEVEPHLSPMHFITGTYEGDAELVKLIGAIRKRYNLPRKSEAIDNARSTNE